jgi:prefoldin subunit 5|nr:MAG TPA: GENERAL CONTROL PROTEIN GCN4, NOR1 BINDING PROTEIN, ALPHA/BETA COILED.6A [Caudoviricetes sp.]
MIILKNTKNTQTFYVSKKCGIESGQLPVGSYTKIESDERFQPKGNYISEEKAEELINTKVTESIEDQVPPLVDQSIDAKLVPINTEITNLKGEVEELETSKMEVFQANQPLSLHRNGEGLQLSVDLSNYATKAEIPDISDFATKEEVALKADKSELSNYVTTEAYNTKMTELDGEISAIKAQIGNISTTLDTINGEIPNE